jgi:hypothetical protein
MSSPLLNLGGPNSSGISARAIPDIDPIVLAQRHANQIAKFAMYFARRNTRLLFTRSGVHGGRCVVPVLLWLRPSVLIR